jgi:hypothetical protein
MRDPARLLTAINARYASDYHPFGAYQGGEQGAFAIVGNGRRAVLKWSPGRGARAEELAATVTARLRPLGYPAPVYLLVGDVLGGIFTIQEELPGTPIGAPAFRLLEAVLMLNALQVGQAPPAPRTWPARLLDTLHEGGDGYCLHEPLRTWSDTTAALLVSLRRIADAQAGRCRGHARLDDCAGEPQGHQTAGQDAAQDRDAASYPLVVVRATARVHRVQGRGTGVYGGRGGPAAYLPGVQPVWAYRPQQPSFPRAVCVPCVRFLAACRPQRGAEYRGQVPC